MSTRNIIVSIILGILVFVVGIGLGMWYQGQKTITGPAVQGQQAPSNVVKALSSKVIPSISAYGAITKIDGANIDLSFQGDTITITFKPDAKIYSFVSTPVATGTKKTTTAPANTKQIQLSELKVTDNLSVSVKLLADGQIQGSSAIVLAPAPAPTAN